MVTEQAKNNHNFPPVRVTRFDYAELHTSVVG